MLISAECSMSEPMTPETRQIVSFSSFKVVREPQYTRDFKCFNNQKSIGVKSGERKNH